MWRCKNALLLKWMNHVLSSSSTSVSGATLAAHEPEESATKNVGKYIIHPWSTAASFSQSLLSIAVIQLFLFRVGQHLIGKTDFFELRRKSRISDTSFPSLTSIFKVWGFLCLYVAWYYKAALIASSVFPLLSFVPSTIKLPPTPTPPFQAVTIHTSIHTSLSCCDHN